MPIPIPPDSAPAIAAGLVGLIQVAGGPTDEQEKVLCAFSAHLLGISLSPLAQAASLEPEQMVTALPEPYGRRVFIQLAIMLDLCRHPHSEQQLARLECYAAALGYDVPQLQAVRGFAHDSAVQATSDFLRVYDNSIPALTEAQFRAYVGTGQKGEACLWQQLRNFSKLPWGSLGREFYEFYQRNQLDLPGPDTPQPGYYVAHDMNHVITGYEPTGPGEIALGVFKLMMNNCEENWMGSMVNFLIHEVGLFKHAKTLQFVPYGKGGEPYHGIDGKVGALAMEGASDLVAEAFERGAACRGDFATMDHLAAAHRPLAEIRRQYHVRPLQHSMRADDDSALWPRGQA